jgi:serine/threonine protein kinase
MLHCMILKLHAPVNDLIHFLVEVLVTSFLNFVDAIKCIELNPSFLKGHYRKASSEIELSRFDDAERTIADATTLEKVHASTANDSVRLSRLLEAARRNTEKGATQKFTPKDFTIGEEIGIGNFTRIVVATLKGSGETFALKLILKSEVDRMKRRHPNIHQEISMEKRALSKLKHPGIITLFSTFQDYYCLYFQVSFTSR